MTKSMSVFVNTQIPMLFEDFLELLDSLKKQGQKIVTTNGCFDIVHAGHVAFLEQAKKLGDVLIVGINSDASVSRIKGAGRPLISANDRARILAAMRAVDYVLIFDDDLPINFLDFVRPDIHCKAGDYVEASLPEAGIVKQNGGKIQILPFSQGYSTTKLVQEIVRSTLEPGVDVKTESGNDWQALISETLLSSSNVLRQVSYQLTRQIEQVAGLLSGALKNGHKILICGNGGSAADAQHFAAELVGRFRKERKALPAISLTTDTSILTAIGNDYGIEHIFSRQVAGLGSPGDVLIAISTSGSSKNIIGALETAKNLSMRTIGLTGSKPSPVFEMSDLCLRIPSVDTPIIQQCHTTILHILCDCIERDL